MERELVARLVAAADVERVLGKARVLYNLAGHRAPSLGASAICTAPACVGLAAAVLRVPCDLGRQAAASGVREAAFLKARATLARLLDVRLGLTAAELVREVGCEPALEATVTRLLDSYGAHDRHAAAEHGADALLGGALLAASAKARARVDKAHVERATGARVPVLLAIAARMRMACPELIALVGAGCASGGKGRKRGRRSTDDCELNGHELDLEAAEAVPALAGTAVVRARREYEQWRARVLGNAGGKGAAAGAAAAAPAAAPVAAAAALEARAAGVGCGRPPARPAPHTQAVQPQRPLMQARLTFCTPPSTTC
ncbi:hypothetical protein KFE25_001217 [Diacronema lutheri]|uniref:ORC6 first cyclin-like domain-containing protein n=1 Tax=Diacronema lutheri TaxID=2081491 RepID=A0A8J5X890_DIALT|nr:hypothetical protein KFE25_001217 [Diacronema lutheri]